MGIWTAGIPDHSFPRRPRVSLPAKWPRAPENSCPRWMLPNGAQCAAEGCCGPSSTPEARTESTRSTTGMRKKAPALDRMALGFLRDPVSGVVHTRETPAAPQSVAACPGCPDLEFRRHTGPEGSIRPGYRSASTGGPAPEPVPPEGEDIRTRTETAGRPRADRDLPGIPGLPAARFRAPPSRMVRKQDGLKLMLRIGRFLENTNALGQNQIRPVLAALLKRPA